jgi:8-oxo-dGTP pyrophosphatase MutT (NUDIX family)
MIYNMKIKHRIIPSVSVVVYGKNQDGIEEVLLHRRKGTGFLDGYYDLPSGHVEPDEMPILAAARELKEETDLNVKAEDLELFHIRTNEVDTPGSPYLYMVFRVEKGKCCGKFKINEPDKCDDMKFFKQSDLPKPITLASRIVIENLDSKVVQFSQKRTP